MGDQSTMESTAGSMSEMSGTESSAAQGGGEGGDKKIFAVLALCLLLAGVVGAVMMFSSGSDAHDVDDAEKQGDTGGSPPAFSSSPPAPPAAAKATTKPTIATNNPEPTTPSEALPPGQTTAEASALTTQPPQPPQPPTTTPPAGPPKPGPTPKPPPKPTPKPPTSTTLVPELLEILCTVGDTAVMTTMYPPEAPCDYLYYTEVVIVNGKIRASKVEASWTTFKAMAKSYSRLRSGIAFDYRYFTTNAVGSATAEFGNLLNGKIGSYGVFIMAYVSDLEAAVNSVKDPMATLKRWQGTSTERKCVIALGAIDYSPAQYTSVKNLMMKVVKDFNVDTVIAISSVALMDTYKDGCFSVPPNVYISQMTKFPSLSTHWELISEKMAYARSTTVGLSFEMGTMIYWLKNNATNVETSMYEKCNSMTMTSREAICSTSSPVYVEKDFFIYGGFLLPGTKQGVAFSEYHLSCASKWEKARRVGTSQGMKLRRRLSLMLFNVHLEDLNKKCSVEPFAVLTYLCESFRGKGKCS